MSSDQKLDGLRVAALVLVLAVRGRLLFVAAILIDFPLETIERLPPIFNRPIERIFADERRC